eukprot:922830-Rhodomonas_salina.1
MKLRGDRRESGDQYHARCPVCRTNLLQFVPAHVSGLSLLLAVAGCAGADARMLQMPGTA